MDGAVAFMILLVAVILSVPAMIIGALWPRTGTYSVVAAVYALPALVLLPYMVTIDGVLNGTVGKQPGGIGAGIGVIGAFGLGVLGFFASRYGGRFRQQFTALSDDATAAAKEK